MFLPARRNLTGLFCGKEDYIEVDVLLLQAALRPVGVAVSL